MFKLLYSLLVIFEFLVATYLNKGDEIKQIITTKINYIAPE